MRTGHIRLEVIVSGFFHVVWLSLLCILCYNIPPSTILDFFSTISVGWAAILASTAFGASFFLGMLVDRVLSDLSSLSSEDQPTIAELKRIRKEKDAIHELESLWVAKAFFRSIGCAGLLIIILALCINARFSSEKPQAIILTVGLLMEAATIFAFFNVREEYRNRLRALTGKKE